MGGKACGGISPDSMPQLPCLQDADILRNILYTGVWNRYNRIQEKKKETQENKKEHKKT